MGDILYFSRLLFTIAVRNAFYDARMFFIPAVMDAYQEDISRIAF